MLGTKDMAALLADLHEAEGVVDQNYSAYRTDSAKRQLRQSVYDKHGLTAADVDTSLAWYGYHIDQYTEVYDRVIEILEKRMAGVKSLKSGKDDENVNLSVDGDTAVVWRTYGPALFIPGMQREFMYASISRDRYWKPGDRYDLKFKTVNASGPVDAALTVTYNDGSSDAAHRTLRGEGWQNLYLRLDTARTATAVSLVLRYTSSPEQLVAAVDSATLTRTRRMQ